MSKVLTTLYEYNCLSDLVAATPLVPQSVLDDYFTDSVVQVVNGFGMYNIVNAKTTTQVALPAGATVVVYLSSLACLAEPVSLSHGIIQPYSNINGVMTNSAQVQGPAAAFTAGVYFPIRVGTLVSVPAAYLNGRADVGMASTAQVYPAPLSLGAYTGNTVLSATVIYYY